MTVEELLKPRYKVIADYPKSIYAVGTIIDAGWRTGDLLYCDPDGPRMSQYPHLFRKLEWWEERDARDLPAYVKYQGKVCKIREYVFRDWMTAFYTDDLKYGVIKYVEQTIPATEAEYNEYIKTKTPQP